jgi:hypothetical protein
MVAGLRRGDRQSRGAAAGNGPDDHDAQIGGAGMLSLFDSALWRLGR